MKDNFNNENKNRIEQRKAYEEKMEKLREEELERKRQELKRTIFDDDPKKNVYKREVSASKTSNTEKPKKDVFTRIILSLTVLFSLAFLVYMIVDSVTKVNQLYQIINASLLFLIVICIVSLYKKRRNVVQVITCLLIVILMGFNGAVMTNILALPKQDVVLDFVNKPLTKAIEWAEENNIKYDQTFEYSDEVKKYSIISQSEKEDTLLKNVKDIKFTVSNGPDYNKEVIISDMTGWNIDDAVKVIKENLLNNVTVNFEENLDIEKDTITYQSKAGKIKRNDAVIFTVSLGDKNNLGPITMKSLKNETLFDALLYLNRNAIDYEIKYEFSDKIEKGNIISTSVKKGDKVNPGDKIILTVSKGKQIVVPELTNMTLSEVTKWIILNNLNIDYADEYNEKIKSGNVISATYKKGDIIEEETTVRIVVSKGKLVMPKFSNLAAFKTWTDTYKIKYETKEEFSEEIAKGEIIKFSVETGKSIDLEKGITVYVSKGKAVTVPDFTGKTKTAIQKECDSLGIKCNFSNEYSTKVTSGTMISQSVKAGEQIAQGDTINIVLATNKKTEVTTTKKSTSSSSSSNNTNSGSSNSGSSSGSSGGSSTPPAQTFNNIFIQVGWLSTSDPSTNCSYIKNNIQKQTSTKVNVACTTKPSSDGRARGKIHENSPYQANNSYSFTEGKTYTFILVE